MEYLDLLLNEGKKYLRDANPRIPDTKEDMAGKPFIGYRSAGRRPEAYNDRRASADAPLAAARGFASGVLGAPGDLEAFARLLPGLGGKTVLPTSEEVERRLPLRQVSETPVGRAATGIGQVGGGLYNGPGAPIRAVTSLPAAVRHGAGEFVDALAVPNTRVYMAHTPSKPNPEVGTRFTREFLGGMAEKKPVRIEDLQGSSLMLMPWDSTSRNMKITSISDEVLPNSVITHGGQDYARDLAHIEKGIAGASNLGIAKRIKDRDAIARRENYDAGGNGNIIHLPVTMGEGGENFSVMPTEALLGLLDLRDLPKKGIYALDQMIREYTIAKGKGEKRVVTTPFTGFKGLGTEEGRMQLYSGEGISSTAGELRKALVDRLTQKKIQQQLNFNHEDLVGALTDPALVGVPKGFAGNTVIGVGDGGMHLRPSSNPTYTTDFTGQYLGSLGYNIPAEVLFPKAFERLAPEFAGKKADLRNMVLGALEKRKDGVSEMVDQRVVDSVNEWIERSQAGGLLSPR